MLVCLCIRAGLRARRGLLPGLAPPLALGFALFAAASGRFLHNASATDLPVVGDWVAVTPPQGDGVAIVQAVLPRHSQFVRRAAGSVLLDGEEIGKLPMHQRARMGIGYLPQEPSIFRRLTVEDNILAVLEALPGLEANQRRERAEVMMSEFGIAHKRDSKGYSLSGGERRRVEIARAVSLQPSFILLDEPFAGIDPISVGDIQRIIAHLRDIGIGVLITDHNVRETLGTSERAYILAQ